MKSWTEVSPYSGIEEDAPANNASSGDVSMPPDAVKKKKKTLAACDTHTHTHTHTATYTRKELQKYLSRW